MKDKRDQTTVDFFTLQKPVGRPRQYSSNADKQKSYRKRLKEAKNINNPNSGVFC